jgi:hypothetical protein
MTVLRNAAATGITGGLLVGCFFLTTLAGLLSWLTWTMRPSVFDAFGGHTCRFRRRAVLYISPCWGAQGYSPRTS